MENNKPSFFSDNRNIAKAGTALLLTALAGYGLLWLLPILSTIIWGTTEVLVGASILGALLYFSGTIIKKLPIINAKLSKMLTGWIIAWDEFIIQEQAIRQAQKDREVIKEQANILYSQVATKDDELQEAREKLKEAEGLVKQLQLRKVPSNDPELMLYANEVARQQDFINDIEPLRNNIDALGKMCKRVYDDTGVKIQDAIAELKLQKTKLASLTAGENAMNKALSIFQGDNPDVLLAQELVKQKIGSKIGSIRNTLDIIKPMMNDRELKNEVKVKRVLEQLSQSTSIPAPQQQVQSSQFNFLKSNNS